MAFKWRCCRIVYLKRENWTFGTHSVSSLLCQDEGKGIWVSLSGVVGVGMLGVIGGYGVSTERKEQF